MSDAVSPRGPCRFCLNARCDPDGVLTDDNDLSYLHIGSVDAAYDHACMHLRSGDHRPKENAPLETGRFSKGINGGFSYEE